MVLLPQDANYGAQEALLAAATPGTGANVPKTANSLYSLVYAGAGAFGVDLVSPLAPTVGGNKPQIAVTSDLIAVGAAGEITNFGPLGVQFFPLWTDGTTVHVAFVLVTVWSLNGAQFARFGTGSHSYPVTAADTAGVQLSLGDVGSSIISGADLSLDGSGNIISAAGGTFMLNLGFVYTVA